MISLGARFADYGLTGGFFLFVWAALFGWLLPSEASQLLSVAQTVLDQNTSTGFVTLVSSVLVAVFILVIFFIGLLLDLLGSLLIMWEIKTFIELARREKGWLEPVLSVYKEFIDNDFEDLLKEEFGSFSKKMLNPFRAAFFFWNRDLRKGVISNQQHEFRRLKRNGLRKSFYRVHSILLYHISLVANPTTITILLNHSHLWHVARSISVGLAIPVIIMLPMFVIFSNENLEMVHIVLYFIVFFVSKILTVRAFSRYFSDLFAVAFVLSKTVPMRETRSEPRRRRAVVSRQETA